MWNGNGRADATLIGDVVRGALAGVAATWVMGLVTSYLYEHESQEARRAEDEARQGRTAYAAAAEKLARAAGRELSEEERKRAGSALHWILGAKAGAVYGVLRHRLPGTDMGYGLLFGTTFWAVVDEGANTVLGLTPPPSEFPWQTHGRGLAGHLVFGLAAEAALRALNRVA